MSGAGESEPREGGAAGPPGGLAWGLAAAGLFGLFTPLGKKLVPHTGPLWLGGLLYLGAGTGTLVLRRLTGAGGPPLAELSGRDRVRLGVQVLVGGVLAPVTMLAGLDRVSAVAGSLLLNLEGPFTMALALGFFGETLGPRELAGCALVMAGAASLALGPGDLALSPVGLGLMVLAAAGWALDNNLIRGLGCLDPVHLTQVKGLVAGFLTLGLALALGQPPPPAWATGAALALGCACYGSSIVLHVHATRLLGAARQGTLMAGAPFLAAMLSVLLLGEHLETRHAWALALLLPGAWLMTRRDAGLGYTPGPG